MCQRINDSSWTRIYDSFRSSPYMFRNDEWLSYENVQSVAEKAQLIQEHSLGGVMIWSIQQDDIDGICGPKQPLLKSINQSLGRLSS